jgi:Ca2+-dependent lipid-binding protein
MGCGSSDLNTVKLNKKRETVFGVLEVKVIEALIEHETTSVFSMDPYVVIKFSNQKRSGTVVKKGGKNPKFNDIFRFIVNSNYKYYGRCLEVELMDSNTAASDSPIGYGIIDLDPYLNALHVKSPESVPGQSIQK